jgi:FkbM family methyltransferase
MRRHIIYLYSLLANIYLYIFSKKYFRLINEVFFNLNLKARGYTNYGSLFLTGEKYFIKILANSNPNLCIDIGANIGNFSKYLIKNTSSNVIAFEPLKKAYIDLKKIEKNFPGRFFAFNYGLSNKNKKSYIFFSDNKSEKATFNVNFDKVTFFSRKSIKKNIVKLFTLDSFYLKNKSLFKRGLDYIKIDSEGYEYQILLGAKRVLNIFKPKFIQIEMNQYNIFNNLNIYQFSKILHNYDVFRMLPYNSGLIKINPIYANNNIFHLSNFIFIRKENKIIL